MDNATLSFSRSDFPEGFVFGTAAAALQIEGSGYGGAGPSHWDTFCATPGNIANSENTLVACDHYHRWEEDLDLVRNAGLDAYRFSLSWPRILPEGRGTPNEEGLDFYDRLIDGMLERGLQPWATLYHWEMPAALSDLGGWRNRDVANWFTDYSRLVMNRFGDRIEGTATLNEPWCVAWLSHFLGHHAPGLRDIRAAAHAMHHVLLAHGTAVQALRADGHDNLGIVCNFEYSQPADDKPETIRAAELNDAIYNRWFVGGIFEKTYPTQVLEGLAPHMPQGWQDDFDVIATPLDWFGINYYTRSVIAADPVSLWPSYMTVPGPLPKTDMGWEIYPEGLLHFLKRVGDLTDRKMPIYVTENGLADSEPVNDLVRTDYMDSHFGAALDAIKSGVPLKGFFTWSLMDNFEWAFGYDKRFGMVHVDFETQKRTPKASWHALRQAISTNQPG
ncbi:GH1 family beta-glucosidase [Amaricoccus tamworthensis]|uniref:GH1 family beta-glucosidase n=1 Tax=Amaricoccus tamworthensis TaxID=57002 RepID=UPI003C7E88FD